MELARVRAPFAAFGGAAALAVGIVMTVGGLALLLAVLSTPQPMMQMVTAVILLLAGILDLRSSRGILRQQRDAMVLSGCATLILVAYVGGALRDFGELFWLNVLFLLLLAAQFRRLPRTT
jgi:hypothetical protein